MTDKPANHILSTTALSIGYEQHGATRCLASDLNLAIRKGEFICLLGPNGAGKSTLIRTLAGAQAPISGQVRIAGKHFDGIPPRERARLVSVVLTEAVSVGMMDAYTMVSLGRHPYSGWFGKLDALDHERIDWAFKAIGAETLAQRQVTELSDGERQKISIARALAQQTSVMLLDEPTAYLDLPGRVELMTILRRLAHEENLALLLSTHDLDLALRFADKLWLLTPQGTIIQGYPEAIAMSNDFAEVFGSKHLDWDLSTGSFRAPATSGLKASLSGEGVAAIWTKRALERLGFAIVEEDHEADVSIQIPGPSEWHVNVNQKSNTFNSICELIDWLKARNWKH